jgi:hypothetical protein
MRVREEDTDRAEEYAIRSRDAALFTRTAHPGEIRNSEGCSSQ